MSVLDKIATLKGVKNDIPNQELAKELVSSRDAAGIKEIAGNLNNRDKNIQSDCIKILYEIGYLDPRLISGYTKDFLVLLKNKQNRLVWGAMIALSTIAVIEADAIHAQRNLIVNALENGSVITADNAVKVLAGVSSANTDYNKELFPHILAHLKTCIPREVAQHSESALIAVNKDNKEAFLEVLKAREEDLSPAQLKRIRNLYKDIGRI